MKIFGLLVALLFASLPARAEEMEFDVEVDTVLICNKAAQVRQFIGLFEGDVRGTLHVVNAKQAGRPACDVAIAAYVFGEDAGKATGPCGQFRIVQIFVLGVLRDEERLRLTVPAPYFTMMPADRIAGRLAKRNFGEAASSAISNPGRPNCRAGSLLDRNVDADQNGRLHDGLNN